MNVQQKLIDAPEVEPVAFMTREGLVASRKQVETNTASSLAASFTIPLYTAPPAPSVPDNVASEPVGYLYTNLQSGEYHVSDADDDYRGPERALWCIEPVYRRAKGQS